MRRHSFHTYRTIRPAHSPSGQTANSTELRPAKKRPVAQACHQCRKAKTKCDGQRPKCITCRSKGRTCSYDGDGQLQSPAARARLQALENIVGVLQNSSLDHANSLLQRIRTADDLTTIIDIPARTTSDLGSTDSQQQTDQESPSKSLNEFAPTLSSSSSESSSDLPIALHEGKWGRKTTLVTREGDQRRRLPDSAPEATFREGLFSADRSTGLTQYRLPDAAVTKKATDSFFSCSGRLFHVFSREQVAQCHSAVFDRRDGPADSSRVSVCSLMAVASVGAQYVSGEFGKETEECFYNIAKHSLDVVIELQPFDAIKVCILIAMYNIMNKATVSLAYIEIGLGICRRYGLNSQSSRPPHLSDSKWIDYRKAWRTLIFISSWLSSTLGYISGNDIICENVVLSEVNVENSHQIADIVQTEMTKICLLKANILRMHLAPKNLTASDIESILYELQSWYLELPEQMKLNRTGQDLPLETKRSLLHVHLLYLGSTMLLYRRIASQFVRPLENDNLLPMPLEALVTKVGGEAILAASTSARILKLLLEENSIFKRCWLVIFQAYTACVVMLHSVAQKQLHSFGSVTLEEDIRHAKDCLSILSFCGSVDHVAAKFHEQLVAIMERMLVQEGNGRSGAKLSERHADSATQSKNGVSSSADKPQQEDFGYLLTLPVHVDTMRLSISLSLFTMLCRPFGNSPSEAYAQFDMKKDWKLSLEQNDYQRMMERLRWNAESNVPFHWNLTLSSPEVDVNKDLTPCANNGHLDLPNNSSNRFLGSMEPSGWSAATDLTEDEGRLTTARTPNRNDDCD